MLREFPYLKKHTLKNLGVKGHDVCNSLPND